MSGLPSCLLKPFEALSLEIKQPSRPVLTANMKGARKRMEWHDDKLHITLLANAAIIVAAVAAAAAPAAAFVAAVTVALAVANATIGVTVIGTVISRVAISRPRRPPRRPSPLRRRSYRLFQRLVGEHFESHLRLVRPAGQESFVISDSCQVLDRLLVNMGEQQASHVRNAE